MPSGSELSSCYATLWWEVTEVAPRPAFPQKKINICLYVNDYLGVRAKFWDEMHLQMTTCCAPTLQAVTHSVSGYQVWSSYSLFSTFKHL